MKKRVLATLLILVLLLSIVPTPIFAANSTGGGTIQYRFREKEYISTRDNLDAPWVLIETSTQYEATGNLKYKYVEYIDYSSGSFDLSTFFVDYIVSAYYRCCKYTAADVPLTTIYLKQSLYNCDEYVTISGRTYHHPKHLHGEYDAYLNDYLCIEYYEKVAYDYYTYYKWSEWSEWSETPVEETENREVETRVVYAPYTVSYDANGGTGAPEAQTQEYGVTLVLSSTIPVKDGFTFLGWSTTPTGDVEYVPSSEYTDLRSIILYAVWEETSSIITDGKCGDNLFWRYSNGIIQIYGYGDMYDFYSGQGTYPPWYPLMTSINEVVMEEGATSIGACAFQNCANLSSITMCSSLVRIRGAAFDNCDKLTSVKIPDSVSTIVSYAFADCNNLSQVTLGNSVTTIGSWAFSECKSLKSIIIPYGVKTIEQEVFYGCSSLESINIPNSVQSIGYRAFYGCSSLTDFDIPLAVKTIGSDAFGQCHSLEKITVAPTNSFFSSDDHGVLFNKTKIELIQYPIGNKANIYTLPNNVECINSKAFHSCKSLSAIVLGSKITEIESYAFASCDNIQTVYYQGSESKWNDISISNHNDPLENANIVFNFIKKVVSISIKELPKKDVYYQGDSLTTDGMVLLVTYNDGTTNDVITGFSCSPTELSTTGSQKITVHYGGQTVDFSIVVHPRTATSITFISLPYKTTYLEGSEKLDISGGKLFITYNDGTSGTVALAESMVSGFDNSIVGTYTLLVTVDNVSTTYSVMIIHNYEISVTAPTCTENGYTTKTCRACGDIQTNDCVAALGHDYDVRFNWVDLNTCFATGTCYRCDNTTEDQSITKACDVSCSDSIVGQLDFTASVELEGKIYTDKHSVTGVINDSVVAVCIPEEVKCDDMLVIIASYSTTGRMMDYKLISFPRQTITETISSGTVRVFFLNSNDYSPIFSSLRVE